MLRQSSLSDDLIQHLRYYILMHLSRKKNISEKQYCTFSLVLCSSLFYVVKCYCGSTIVDDYKQLLRINSVYEIPDSCTVTFSQGMFSHTADVRLT